MTRADRLLTQREVCPRLRISPKTLQIWRRIGRIRFANFGHRTIRIRESEVERIARQEETLQSPARPEQRSWIEHVFEWLDQNLPEPICKRGQQ